MLAACTYVSSSWPPHAFTLSKGHPPCYLQVDGRVSGDLHLLGVDVDDRDSYEGVNDYMQAVVRAIADMLCSNYLGESDFDMQAETSAKPMLDKMVELAPTFRSHADGFLKVVPSLKESYADDDFYGGESFEVVRECAEAFAGLRWGFTSEYDESSGGAGSGVATNGSVPSRAHTCIPQPRTHAHTLIYHMHSPHALSTSVPLPLRWTIEGLASRPSPRRSRPRLRLQRCALPRIPHSPRLHSSRSPPLHAYTVSTQLSTLATQPARHLIMPHQHALTACVYHVSGGRSRV
jgi:hypothetical protein